MVDLEAPVERNLTRVAKALGKDVNDLTAMISQLERAGISVETRAEWDMPGVGRFARIQDPEGNPVELWQPAE